MAKKFDLKTVKALAQNYRTRTEFVAGDESAYRWARRNGKLDEVCEHMPRRAPNFKQKHDEQSVQCEALKYSSKAEFRRWSGGAYSWAYKHGVLDKVCSHMEVTGNRHRRALYVYEFANKKAYVGLTYKYSQRHAAHMRRGPVSREARCTSFKYKTLDVWMEAKEAQQAEAALIEKYERDGWTMLNQRPAGDLGGDTLIWTDENLRAEVKKYESLSKFRDSSPSAYATASQRGIIDSFDHLIRERIFWDFESTAEEAQKYANRTDFRKDSPGAADWAYTNGHFDEVCRHMDYARSYWTIDSVQAEAEKYFRRSDFRKGSGSAYAWALRNSVLDEICAHMEAPSTHSKWNLENVKKKAKQYQTRGDFMKYASGAYKWAARNKKLDEVCGHMRTGVNRKNE